MKDAPPRPPDRVALRARQVDRAAADLIRSLIEATADRLENPEPPERNRGDQTHFLERLERLDDEPRARALRLYYHAALSRFVARRAFDQPLDHLYQPPPADRRPPPKRLALALDAGDEPPWLILDETGQVITCLAPGMEVGGARRDFADLAGWFYDFERWSEQNRSARERARAEGLHRDVFEIIDQGWWASRESIRSLAGLGDAGAILILESLHDSLELFLGSFDFAVLAGQRDDRALRLWLRAAGSVAAFCAILADGRMPPPDEPTLRACLGVACPPLGMVIGAGLARWRPDDAGPLINPTSAERTPANPGALIPAAAVYWGTRRRLAPRAERERIQRSTDVALREILDDARAQLAAIQGSASGSRTLLAFLGDLAQLALEEEPDWGGDRVEYPQRLPPLRLDDLCLPGRVSSPVGLRRLAQRLLCEPPEELASLFCTRAEIADWRERLGPPERPRTGTFHFPYADPDLPRAASGPTLGRNDPCPCGSGRKYKRCCLGKPSAPPNAPEPQRRDAGGGGKP